MQRPAGHRRTLSPPVAVSVGVAAMPYVRRMNDGHMPRPAAAEQQPPTNAPRRDATRDDDLRARTSTSGHPAGDRNREARGSQVEPIDGTGSPPTVRLEG
jgi:hypothetical protein